MNHSILRKMVAMWSLEFWYPCSLLRVCLCGIGLAVPTALLVGSGLGAKYGILARGGGEDSMIVDSHMHMENGELSPRLLLI